MRPRSPDRLWIGLGLIAAGLLALALAWAYGAGFEMPAFESVR